MTQFKPIHLGGTDVKYVLFQLALFVVCVLVGIGFATFIPANLFLWVVCGSVAAIIGITVANLTSTEPLSFSGWLIAVFLVATINATMLMW